PKEVEPARRQTVGRQRETTGLRAAFNATTSSGGLMACVSGEPGIGKTTLVESFLADLSGQCSCFVGRGRCSERLAGTEAYLPILEALESLLRSEGGDAIGRSMKLLAPSWYAQVVPLATEPSGELVGARAVSQERLKQEFIHFLQETARLRP